MPRYIVVENSQSAHCCFEATVVDSHTPRASYPNDDKYEQICECFSVAEAQKIADALNAVDKAEQLKRTVELRKRLARDYDSVKEAVLRVRDKKGKPAALEVLRKLGVAAVQHIPTEKFDEAHRLCEEALQ
jgi:hypothetical protein